MNDNRIRAGCRGMPKRPVAGDLDAETRILFVCRRYIYLESVDELAGRFKISKKHVSVKLFRARKKLKKLPEKTKL